MSDHRKTSGHDLVYNRYDASYATLKDKVSLAEDEVGERRTLLDWYSSFDVVKAFAELDNIRWEIGSLKLELEQIPPQLTRQHARLAGLRHAASLGPDPRYWFSSERSTKKRELREQEKVLEQLTDKWNNLPLRLKAKEEQESKQKTEFERYRGFDLLEEKAAENEMSRQLMLLRSELEKVQALKKEIDQQLIVPSANLRDLIMRKEIMENELSNAESLDSRLSSASNGHERWQVHVECGNMFSESRPSRVINDRKRKLETINRDIRKAEERLELEGLHAFHRTIAKTLVIDGSNLCYEGQNFIGLSALRAIALGLYSRYNLIIVFDASIRNRLKMGNQEIASYFGDTIKVHVMASEQKADEMLLDAAAADDVLVISNDRFGDFPDKQVIREQRVKRHEIMNDQINIYALKFKGAYR